MNIISGDEKKQRRPHNIMIYNRRQMVVSGVIRVENFNETAICSLTENGLLTIEGESLHISKLSLETGDMSVDGTINGIFYSEDTQQGGKKAKNMFGKIFK